ncbi:MAG: hypothetical protein KKA07_16880 [Bacteroidetes bacterium]|nr:hypothetical protein [Bacteroidota bacterium]MBU1720743.1 hypothetical protein [Bacteroidota bacterium]
MTKSLLLLIIVLLSTISKAQQYRCWENVTVYSDCMLLKKVGKLIAGSYVSVQEQACSDNAMGTPVVLVSSDKMKGWVFKESIMSEADRNDGVFRTFETASECRQLSAIKTYELRLWFVAV